MSHRVQVQSPIKLRALRGAAVKAALAQSTTSTCSGQISPDTVYDCSNPSSTGTDTYTLTLTRSSDLLLIEALDSSGITLGITLTDPSNTPVTCQEPDTMFHCTVDSPGTYTLQVSSGNASYTLSYMAVLSDTTCSNISTSFAAPALQGTVPVGAIGSCFAVDAKSGDVLHASMTSAIYLTVYDSTGTQQCLPNGFGLYSDCALAGTGPYRIIVSAPTYDIQINDLTNATGCQAVTPQPYDVAPSLTSTKRCRTITASKPGQYIAFPLSQDVSSQVSGELYDNSGAPVCPSWQQLCQLSAGVYHFVAAENPGTTLPYGMIYFPTTQSTGCTLTGDHGFTQGPSTGSFSGFGEEICLTLPTTASLTDYLIDEPPNPQAGNLMASMMVLDSNGQQPCPDTNGNFSYQTCTLTGTAPFHVILTNAGSGSLDPQLSAYRLLVQRSDDTAGCGSWPRSAFGSTAGIQVRPTFYDGCGSAGVTVT
jgi:hypothetical protein